MQIRAEACGVCKEATYRDQRQAERVEAPQDRKCLWCSGPIPSEARGDVIYCSKTCQGRSQSDMQKTRRTCQRCGKVLRGFGKFCTHDCYGKSKRTLRPRECPICQATFKPHRPEQVCCSQPCRYEPQRRAKAREG